jgi:hypothetical protein
VAAGYGEPTLTAAAGLDLPPVSFDAALSRFGIIFEPEAEAAPDPGGAWGLLEGGGFSDVVVEEIEVSFEWESADEFVAMVKDTVPPLIASDEARRVDSAGCLPDDPRDDSGSSRRCRDAPVHGR